MKPKKGRFSKLLVSCILIFALLFTIAVLVVFWHTGAEPVVLVGAVFAACFGELWALAGIKKSKEKKDITSREENYRE